MNNNYIELEIYFNKALYLYKHNQILLKLYNETHNIYFLQYMIYNLNKCYKIYHIYDNIIIKHIFEKIKIQVMNILITLHPEEYNLLINIIEK